MSPGLFGVLWQPPKQTIEELARARRFLETRHGTDALTGAVYGCPPTIEGVQADPSILAGYWLFELVAPRPAE